MFLSVIFLCGLFSLSLAHESRQCLTEEERLFHDLIDGYAPHQLHTRPVNEHNDTIQVSVGMSFIHINAFDEDTGVGEFLTWDKYKWTDSRLTWNADHYGGIHSIRIPANLIWQPDIATYNSLWSRESDNIGDFMAYVTCTGQVLYIPIHTRKTKCKELKNPISDDEFECSFKIGSWTYSADLLALDFFGGTEKLEISDYMGDAYHITGNTAVLNTKTYDCCPESYQDITFTITFSDDEV